MHNLAAFGSEMSEQLVRCPHCGLPHQRSQLVCPATGLAVPSSAPATGSNPPPRLVPASAPPPPRITPPPMRATPGTAHTPRPTPPPRAAVTGPAATIGAPSDPDATAQRALIGGMISDRYVVRSVLGEGGMGTVYEAEHVGLGRAVAIKVLHPSHAKKTTSLKRFYQEARAAGTIGHPNICEVYDLGTLEDGSPYLVMEKLAGETLASRIIREGGLAFDDIIEILVQVLSGLIAAHDKGIVHRDMKPDNVFLTPRVGCPPLAKILDFGVSKMMGEGEEMDLTRTGMVMGTPFYMSPEQARGERNLDSRVDLWACGVILYETLTGRRPFIAANYNALLISILTTTPTPAHELRPSIPSGFQRVLGRALERAREQRYQTAAEFQADLLSVRAELTDDMRSYGSASKLRASMPPPWLPTATRPATDLSDVGDDSDELPTQVLARTGEEDTDKTKPQEEEEESTERTPKLVQSDEVRVVATEDDPLHDEDSDPSVPTKILPKR